MVVLPLTTATPFCLSPPSLMEEEDLSYVDLRDSLEYELLEERPVGLVEVVGVVEEPRGAFAVPQ